MPTRSSFGWEMTPRIEPQRLWRKIIQLAVNEALFVGSGSVAMIMFFVITTPSSTTWWLVGIGTILLAVLIKIGRSADIRTR